jgi:hypothetical protein
MDAWWQLAIVVAIVWLVLRFARSLFKPREPSESVEDPLAGVPSPKRRGRQNRSGAVALAEPDEEDENRRCPSQVVNRVFSVSLCFRGGFAAT